MIHDNIAITAAHCILNPENGDTAVSVELWPGKKGYGAWNNPFGTTTATEFHMPNAWISNASAEDDWALLVLDDDIGLECGWFGIGWADSDWTGTQITISGYPQDEYDPEQLIPRINYFQYSMTDYITDCSTKVLYYDNLDASKGQSGSPVFTSDYVICGIYCYGFSQVNFGPGITHTIYNYFLTHID